MPKGPTAFKPKNNRNINMNNEQIQNKLNKIDDALTEIRGVIDTDKQELIKRIEELEKRLSQQKAG